MFQGFDAKTSPDQGPPRLAALRAELSRRGLSGFIVPRADAHQGEYVSDHDDRLAWLTGFTGSAGFAVVLPDIAGIFVDGRYRVQVRAQVDTDAFTPVAWPDTQAGPWIADHLSSGKLAYDPWLHTLRDISAIEKALEGTGVELVPSDNPLDAIWHDQPAPPQGAIRFHPIELSGKRSPEKRRDCAATLTEAGHSAAVLTLPDSIAWLLNIRGSDIPRIPVAHAFAILMDSGRVKLFIDPAKVEGLPPDPDIDIFTPDAFDVALRGLTGTVRVDRATAPVAVSHTLEDAGIDIAYDDDPCILPKATKNPTEIDGTRAAHLRDAAAMVEFLAWLDDEAPKGRLTEIDCVKALEGFRRATNALQDISFETISGAGPNGAIVHYRVTETTNRALQSGELLLIDSGGQYLDGTTDITRTIAIGTPPEDARRCFTRVLGGMITMSMARWPVGLAGRDLDALARFSLWQAGMDYDHGTGHGVGSYLSVHEGPQRLSRVATEPLQPGMILSNEPGYYREGAFGIRIENLVVVREAPALPGGDDRDMLDFETLTYVPIDRRLIDPDLLGPDARAWLNSYHSKIPDKISTRLSDRALGWLAEAVRPI